jgi:ribonuclease HI
MMQSVEIYTDGACKGNPGPGGWGVLLRYGRHEKQLYGGEAETTNNRMELTAVIQGLQGLKRTSKVCIVTDSQYVKNGITQWIHNWKRNGWRTAGKQPVKNADLWRQLEREVAKHEIEWRWVKGHSGHPENELADQLANRGIEELK